MSSDTFSTRTPLGESTICKTALEYAERGWKVFPLAPNIKKPAFEGWQEKATTDPDIIRKWWGSPGLFEFNGIAIKTGADSGIWVLDLDVKNDTNGVQLFEELLQEHSDKEIPAHGSMTAMSPSGGRHIYYQYSGVKVPQRVGLLPGIDARGDGGFIIAPPTRLNSGQYTWVSPLGSTSAAPKWLLDIVTATNVVTQQSSKGYQNIKTGTRYTTLRALRCSLTAKGILEYLIENLLKNLNQKHTNGNPLTDLEMKNVLQVPTDIPNPKLKIKHEIILQGPIEEITRQIIVVLQQSNTPPRFFVRDGQPYRAAKNEMGRFVLQSLLDYRLKYEVSRLCSFYRSAVNKDTKEKFLAECSVTDPIIKDLLAYPLLPFPPFVGFTETPFVTPTGNTISVEGYDTETQMYYAPCSGLNLGTIPDDPSDEDIRAAFALLEEVICDFPFETQADKENCIAALIHPVLRPTIKTYVPILLIDKPQPGVGASLISDIMNIIATGYLANKQSEAPNNDEWEKRIDSVLRAGRIIAIVDNVHHTLDSSSLAAVVTMDSKDVRIFGKTCIEKMPNRTLWIINGNNISVSEEIARRCFRVRMDSPSAKPYQRNEEEFRHPDLVGWVMDNRDRILTAILTIIRAAIIRKAQPNANVPRMGSFREWRGLIGGIMSLGGYEKFLTNLDNLYDDADMNLPEWGLFFEMWFKAVGNEPKKPQEIKYMVEGRPEMRDCMPDNLQDALMKGTFTKVLGQSFKTIKDVKFPAGYTLKKGKTINGYQTYRVYKVGN